MSATSNDNVVKVRVESVFGQTVAATRPSNPTVICVFRIPGKCIFPPTLRDKPRANYDRQPSGIGSESVRERTGGTDTCNCAPPPRFLDLLERVSSVLGGEPIHHGRDGLANL